MFAMPSGLLSPRVAFWGMVASWGFQNIPVWFKFPILMRWVSVTGRLYGFGTVFHSGEPMEMIAHIAFERAGRSTIHSELA